MMIEQRARVVAIDARHFHVRPLQRKDCARCASGQGCGSQLFGRRVDADTSLPVPVPADSAIAVGDVVVLAIAPQLLQRSTLLLYALPLLMLLLISGLLSVLQVPEVWVACAALLTLLASLWASHRFSGRLATSAAVHVLGKVADSACEREP